MRLAFSVLAGGLAIGAAAAWILTEPSTIGLAELAPHEPDLANGELLFMAGGCISCHAAEGTEGDAKLVLAGGHRLETPFGTFIAPNISPNLEHGIGKWRPVDFINAMQHGTSPDGEHYYPAFPFASYARMNQDDLLDMWAYIQTLPPSEQASDLNQLSFPFNIRRAVGLWKMLYLDPQFVTSEPDDPLMARGRYLVEGPGHCGECHTPRDALGGPDESQWLAGAANPSGKGVIPNITPGDDDFASWSEADIVEYLTSGFTPEYDSAGGTMVAVIDNISQLPTSDREAIAIYLKRLPEMANGHP